MAAAVGLPIALISLAKAALILFTLMALLGVGQPHSPNIGLRTMTTPVVILAALAYLALSMTWTTVPVAVAVDAWAKHAKLLLIPILLWLIRSERDAHMALLCFLVSQVVLLLGSWLLWLGVPVPWATSRMALTGYAVFSSYLDQAIMSGVTAVICWHLRPLVTHRWLAHICLAVTVLAIGNVFFVFAGRTGHVVLIVLISLAVMWALPNRYRILAILTPLLVVGTLFATSQKAQSRIVAVVTELNSYNQTGNIQTSSGERINYWRRSVQSIMQNPLTGTGVGSWNVEFIRLNQTPVATAPTSVRNPHQEFLLWGVEAGVPGVVLLGGILLAAYRDSMKMSTVAARATISVLAALATSCLFNSSLFDATIGDFFCVVLGILLAWGWQTHARKASPEKGKEGARPCHV